MKKTGLAHSPLFSHPPGMTILHETQTVNKSHEETVSPALSEPVNEKDTTHRDTMASSNRDTTVSGNHDTTVSDHHDATMPRHRDTIQQVVASVREIGKEAATHRFTKAEKEAVAELIYVYKRKGIKTTENEIVRIALNYVIKVYREAGDKSLLSEVLQLRDKA